MYFNENHRKSEAEGTLASIFLIVSLGLFITPVIYFFFGFWKEWLTCLFCSTFIFVFFPLFLRSYLKLFKNIIKCLDKHWENWWKYLG